MIAIPLPFYNGLLWWWRGRFVCECGRRFWRNSSYEEHWLGAHGVYAAMKEVERLTEKNYHLSNARRKDCAELDRLRGFVPDEQEEAAASKEVAGD